MITALMLACSGGGDGGNNNNGGTTPSFAISLSPSTLSIDRGSTGTATLTVTPSNGFSGILSGLAQSGLPSGASAQWSQSGQYTYSLVFTVAASAVPGTYPFTLTATAPGAPAALANAILTIPGAPSPSFSLATNPSSLSLVQGSAGTATVTITGSGGFAGSVALSAAGLPSGVTAAFSPASATSSSTLTLTVAGGAAVGTSTLTITGQSSGVANASTTLSLTVTGSAQPSFSLGVAPAALSLAKGSAGTATVTVTGSGGFAGSVALSASGLPSGVTAAFSPATTTSSSTLTLTVASGAATGLSTITLTGQSNGVANASTSVALTVTQPSGGTQVSMSPCLQDNDVVFFAVQDGGGPWTPVTGSGGTYTFSLASGRGAVAITLRGQLAPDELYTMILMGSTAELAQQMQTPCPGFQSVSGTYSAGAGHTVSVALGIAGITNVTVPAGGAGPWTTGTVMKKASGDLFAAESIPGGATVKCILRRDIPLSGPNPPIGGDLNFGGAEAFAPGSAAIALSGLGTGYVVTAICHLWSPGLDVGVVGASFSFLGGDPPPIAVVPAAKLRAGDLQSIIATAMPPDYGTSNGTSAMLLSQYWMATPADVSLPFQAAAATPVVALSQSLPHPRLRFTSSFAAPYTNAFLFNAVQTAGSTSSRGWQVLLSPGWLTAGGGWPVDTPDFTGLAGWNPAWDLWAGGQILWTTTNSGTNGPDRTHGSRQWTCNYTGFLNP